MDISKMSLTKVPNLRLLLPGTYQKKTVPFHVGDMNLSKIWAFVDLPGLGGCGSLHTLDLSKCVRLMDISTLGGCGSLQTLNLSGCKELSDISALGRCMSLHTLELSARLALGNIHTLSICNSLVTLEFHSPRATFSKAEVTKFVNDNS